MRAPTNKAHGRPIGGSAEQLIFALMKSRLISFNRLRVLGNKIVKPEADLR